MTSFSAAFIDMMLCQIVCTLPASRPLFWQLHSQKLDLQLQLQVDIARLQWQVSCHAVLANFLLLLSVLDVFLFQIKSEHQNVTVPSSIC